MNSTDPHPLEHLNAFVDGELAPEEHAAILLARQSSPELSARIEELRNLKDLVQMAYREPQRSEPAAFAVLPGLASLRRPARSHRTVAAYLLCMLLGALGAYAVTMSLPGEIAPGARAAHEVEQSLGLASGETVATGTKVVFHIAADDPGAAQAALDQVEYILEAYRDAARPLRVAVVANGDGVRFYQSGRTRQAARIAQLFDRFDNVTFEICGNTLDRLRRAGVKPIDVVPEAVIIASGVRELSRLQRRGWLYIRV